MHEPIRILLAEDEAVIAAIIQDLLDSQGYQVTVCSDGQSAWARLQTDSAYDVVLLDRMMPYMDGMALLRKIKAEPALTHTPVIMETALGDQESIREGLAEGAYYYLTKPLQAEVLLAVVQAAVSQAHEYQLLVESVRRAEQPLALLQSGSFRFRDLDEGRMLAGYLAHACPQPERAVQGLQELLVNAVEHGNLGISYADKSALMLEGAWQEDIQRRLQLPEYRERYVEVHFQRRPDALRFTIQDQGEGFNWKEYLDFSPDRAFDLHGRGIAITRKLCCDHLEYQGNGSTVIATFDYTTALSDQGC
ncbi:MAG: response regulator [Methylococcaceae bacterium]|nr:MAG: response regulator [Methylococcaceae bacterium]